MISHRGVWSAPPVAWTTSDPITSTSLWWSLWTQGRPPGQAPPPSASEFPTAMTRRPSSRRACRNTSLLLYFLFLYFTSVSPTCCHLLKFEHVNKHQQHHQCVSLSLSACLSPTVSLLINLFSIQDLFLIPAFLLHLFSRRRHLSSRCSVCLLHTSVLLFSMCDIIFSLSWIKSLHLSLCFPLGQL